MTERGEDRFQEGQGGEPLARLAPRDAGQAVLSIGTTERVESLIRALERALRGDWPTAEELRHLPPEDFANLARQLSLVIDRLSTLRIELLGAGARCNARF